MSPAETSLLPFVVYFIAVLLLVATTIAAVALVLLVTTTAVSIFLLILLVRWLLVSEAAHLRNESVLIVVRLLRFLRLLPRIVFLRELAELLSRAAVR